MTDLMTLVSKWPHNPYCSKYNPCHRCQIERFVTEQAGDVGDGHILRRVLGEPKEVASNEPTG